MDYPSRATGFHTRREPSPSKPFTSLIAMSATREALRGEGRPCIHCRRAAPTIVCLLHKRIRGTCHSPRMSSESSVSPVEGLITKREVARRLRKTPRCIELWMRARYIPYIKIGRSVLFDWSAVLASLSRFEIK